MSRSAFSYVGAAVAAYFGYYQVAASLLAAGVSSERARRARNQARDAYNASLQDRMVMLDLQPDSPRTLALGRVRAVEGVRRRWVSGTNSEHLTLIVSFAGHQIDGFESFWFDDIELTLDGNGYVQTAPYTKTGAVSYSQSVTLNGSGGASVTTSTVPTAGTIKAVWGEGVGDASVQGECTVTGSGTAWTLSGGSPGAACTVTWQTDVGTPMARIRPYLGTDAQNVGADLAAEYPGHITSADRFAGIALAVVDLTFDPDVFPQGIPNISATFRGALCLDPRDNSTAWTENPALHAYHYARWAYGWAVPAAEIRTADITAAANFCDTSTTFTLGVDDVVLPRYRCGLVISSSADPRASMEDIMQTMAGRWGWAGGTWRMRCGRMASAAWALDASWIAQRVGANGVPDQAPVVRMTNGVPREDKCNRVSGACVDPAQRYQSLPYPSVRDDVMIAADGAEYPLEVNFGGVNHIAHAQHLASIIIREGQAPLRMEVMANLSAYALELFDVGTVTIDRYGMSGKTMEVTGWRWRPTDGVQLRLAEITADIFTVVDSLTGRDPAPNGNLPPPWLVLQVAGVAVTSGTDVLTDGSVLTRTRVTWTAPTSQAVLVGGHIEVQHTLAADALPSGDWDSWLEQGSAAAATIPGLLSGRYYVFRVRAINAMGVRGPWSTQVLHKVADPPTAVGQYTDFIFKRSATQPATPTGTAPAGWSDAPPAADGNPLWFSSADRAGGGALLTAWSTPVQIDGESLQAQYSVDGATAWHSTFVAGDLYARYRIGSGGAWSSAIKIVGEDGTYTDYVFKRSAAQPATPTGIGTPAGWSDAPPAADGNPLWVSIADKHLDGSLVGAWSVPVQIDGDSVQVQYSVDGATNWHAVFVTGDLWARYRTGNAGAWSSAVRIVGEAGANGTRTATLRVYRWSASTPVTFPSGTSTYTWATAVYTAPSVPSGWSLTSGAAVAGQTLWVCEQRYADNATTATSVVTWSSSTALALGSGGTAGTTGASAARAYALYTGNPTVSGAPVVTSGTAMPSAAAWSPTAASSWSNNPQTPATGQSMFQSDGLYDPATNTTTWQVPYLSHFKVGNLAALAADLGTVTAGTITGTSSISITGSARFDGVNSAISIPDPFNSPSTINRTIAAIVNSGGSAQIGLYGVSATAGSWGLFGLNTSAGAGSAGVQGFGYYGMRGVSNSAGAGVYGTTTGTTGASGVHGAAGGSGTWAVTAQADGFGQGGDALRVLGRAQITDRITSTYSTAAPIVLPVLGSKPAAISGGVALHSTYGLIVSDGVNWYAASALQVVP